MLGLSMVPALISCAGDSSDASDGPRAEPDAGLAPFTCEDGAKDGSPLGSTSAHTSRGTAMIVRVPNTYDPTTGSPLIVVYAAAGGDPGIMESATGLSSPALARGYLVAYVDYLDANSWTDVDEAASVIDWVSSKWCIDPRRVYLTGHSVGGSLPIMIVLENLAKPAAIAPSAAGLRLQTIKGLWSSCNPMPMIQLHSSADEIFPESSGFGEDVAEWWATTCNGCNTTPGDALDDGCIPYIECTDGAEVQFCEGNLPHGNWPSHNEDILDFFDGFIRNTD
jgi:polyhydroxybutyrate depolymerase